MVTPAPEVSGRRNGDGNRLRAQLVAVIAGLSLAPYFWVASAIVGWPGADSPAIGASASAYVEFYADGISRIPAAATVAIGSWAIWLTLVVSVVRAACRRFDLAAILAVTMTGASTAVYVAAEGLLAWPTVGMTAAEISASLDPGVARALVMSRDGLHGAAAVLLGIALGLVAWLLARSDLWGRWVLAVLALPAAASSCASMILGPEELGAGAVMLWGIVVAVVVVLRRWRTARRAEPAPPG